jgi:RNA polymerase sigma-70 factor (ECF subfamily)
MADYVEMPDTMWSLIAQARKGGDQALDAILRKYRPPILAFIRNLGLSREDAEDLVQEVFLTILEDDVLARADKSRGRFRSLLLSVARHVITDRRRGDSTLKRGGDRKRVPFPDQTERSEESLRDELLKVDATDSAFDPLWVQNLVRLGMNLLWEECARDGTPYFQALSLQVEEGLDHAGIAERLGVGPNDIKNHLHQGRVRLKRHVLKEMQSYCSSRGVTACLRAPLPGLPSEKGL